MKDFLGMSALFLMDPQLLFNKIQEGWNCQFQKAARTECGDKAQGSVGVGPRFPAGLLFPVPEIQTRKCPYKKFWTKNRRGGSGDCLGGQARLFMLGFYPICEVFSGPPTGLT